MKETMHDCYLSQFNCMKNILVNKQGILKEFVDFYITTMPDRIYLLGSGTSYNACTVAAPFMEKTLDVEVTPIVPSSMGKLYGKKPLVIVVSQSGRSTNTINAINKINETGASVVTLTDPKDTPVGNMGDLSVHLAADNESVGPRTRGYTSTILTLYLMALEAGLICGTIEEADYDKAMASYNETIDNGEKYFKACQDFYDLNLENLRKARKFIFVGKGTAAKVAEESALKVLETLCYPAIGYEYEEFLHGPVCCADEELALFLSLSCDEDKGRMLKTADIIGNITRNCYIVTHDPSVKGDKVLILPSTEPSYSSAFTNILFGQLISARLTEDLARTRHPGVKNIFDNMGTKISVNATNERR